MSNLIYKPKGPAGEYSTWACNLYNGCSHQCSYCYRKRGLLSHALGGNMPTLQKKAGESIGQAASTFLKELLGKKEQIIADGGIFFSFTTDPMLQETIEGTMACTELALRSGVPVQILTKATWWIDNPGIVETLYEFRGLVRVGFTLTGHDELEPFAPANEERIQTMQYLTDCHIPVFASVEPVIDFASSLKMILDIADFCQDIRIGLLSPYSAKRYDPKECERFVDKVTEIGNEKGIEIQWKRSIIRFYEEVVCNQEDR